MFEPLNVQAFAKASLNGIPTKAAGMNLRHKKALKKMFRKNVSWRNRVATILASAGVKLLRLAVAISGGKKQQKSPVDDHFA